MTVCLAIQLYGLSDGWFVTVSRYSRNGDTAVRFVCTARYDGRNGWIVTVRDTALQLVTTTTVGNVTVRDTALQLVTTVTMVGS